MRLYPAIDLKDGQCVRLLHGEMDKATVFNDSPVAQAKAFEEMGFDYLHIVDLNGAFAGRSENGEVVEAILNATTIPAQLGGGIRDMDGVDTWLERGVSRVILGTAAVREPDFVREAARTFENQIVVGIDARDGMVAVEGWAETSNIDAISLAKQFEDAGVAAIIYTDIGRDGALTGLNIDATVKLADTVSIPVIASGGLASMADVDALIREGEFIDGAIAGRALYDGRLDAHEAIAKIKAYNEGKK